MHKFAAVIAATGLLAIGVVATASGGPPPHSDGPALKLIEHTAFAYLEPNGDGTYRGSAQADCEKGSVVVTVGSTVVAEGVSYDNRSTIGTERGSDTAYLVAIESHTSGDVVAEAWCEKGTAIEEP